MRKTIESATPKRLHTLINQNGIPIHLNEKALTLLKTWLQNSDPLRELRALKKQKIPKISTEKLSKTLKYKLSTLIKLTIGEKKESLKNVEAMLNYSIKKLGIATIIVSQINTILEQIKNHATLSNTPLSGAWIGQLDTSSSFSIPGEENRQVGQWAANCQALHRETLKEFTSGSVDTLSSEYATLIRDTHIVETWLSKGGYLLPEEQRASWINRATSLEKKGL